MSKFFYVVGIAVVMMSCGKDIDLFVPRESQGPVGDITRLKERLLDGIQDDIVSTIKVPCDGDKAFQIGDLVIDIPAGFVDLTLYPCSSGYFDLEVTICDSKGEILIAGIPTISEGTLLESRIEVKLQLKQAGSVVHLNHGKTIRLLVNDPDPRDRMELFFGNADNSEWLQADNNPDTWDNVANTEWFIQQDSNQTISGFGYECFADTMDWINVDVFFAIPEDQRTTVCVELPEEYTNTNTQIFMVFDDYKSIVHLPGNADIKQFCEHYGSTPIGFNVTIVAISELGEGTYMFASKSTSVTENLEVKLSPVRTPFNEIENYLRAL